MALSMPISPVNIPTIIEDQPNGAVDPALLWTVEAERTQLVWLMAELPARGMRAWHAAALSVGIVLGSTGRGRTYTQQVNLFESRYTLFKTSFTSGVPSYVTKYWPDHGLYYQEPNTSMAAIPGTSNHGYWCADDLAEFVNGVMLPSIRPATLQWLFATAHLYGFAWETTKEPWHVHWIMGDVIPKAVLDFEKPWPTPVPTPTPPPVSSDLMITIYKLTDAQAQFVAYTVAGVALQVEWTGDGSDPLVQERMTILKQFGAVEITVSVQDISRTTLIGPLPIGDSQHFWKSSDFLKHVL